MTAGAGAVPGEGASSGVRCARPVHVPGPDGPWHGVRESLAGLGNAVVYATGARWGPAVAALPRLRELLGADWDRYSRIADPAARGRFAAARLLVKCAAGSVLGIAPQQLDLAYRLGGRPYLRGFGQVEVSLSHTGDLMAVALSRTGRIGVDVEPAGRAVRLDLLRARILTPREAAEVAGLPEQERGPHVLRLWTLKEAYSKALGQGLRLGFKEFGFSGGRLLHTADGGAADGGGEWGFATHRVLDRRYLLSIACHDAGLATAHQVSAGSMLDQGFVSAMNEPGR